MPSKTHGSSQVGHAQARLWRHLRDVQSIYMVFNYFVLFCCISNWFERFSTILFGFVMVINTDFCMFLPFSVISSRAKQRYHLANAATKSGEHRWKTMPESSKIHLKVHPKSIKMVSVGVVGWLPGAVWFREQSQGGAVSSFSVFLFILLIFGLFWDPVKIQGGTRNGQKKNNTATFWLLEAAPGSQKVVLGEDPQKIMIVDWFVVGF